MIPFGKPMLGEEERAAVAEVLDGTTLTHGPRVKEFEAAFAEFTGAPHAIATATCMASLHLAYLFLELGPGDEVLVPAQTHVAMAHAVEACGAQARLRATADPRTGNVDLDQLESLVDAAHARDLGRPLPRPAGRHGARARDRRAGTTCFVVEDCAIALGAALRRRRTSACSATSAASPSIRSSTSPPARAGWSITTRDDVAERVSKQRAFGIDKSVLADRRHTGAYEIEHARPQLPPRRDRRRDGRRADEAAARASSRQRERNFELLVGGPGGDRRAARARDRPRRRPALQPLLPVRGARRGAATSGARRSSTQLKAEGVGTSVYYPKPLPDTRYYRETYGYERGFLPGGDAHQHGSIAFPVGPHVEEGDVETIVETVKRVLAEVTVRG